MPKTVVVDDKEKAKYNVQSLLGVMKSLLAKKRSAIEVGYEPLEGHTNCSYDPWLCAIDYYFGKLSMYKFLVEVSFDDLEWLSVFEDFMEYCQAFHFKFGMDAVKLAVEKLKKLDELLSN